MNSVSDKICVVNDRLFYLDGDGTQELFCIPKKGTVFVYKDYVLFVEFTVLNWNRRDANDLCVSILLYYMGRYLEVIGKIHDDEYMIYIFTDKFINGTPSIFNKSNYRGWYK